MTMRLKNLKKKPEEEETKCSKVLVFATTRNAVPPPAPSHVLQHTAKSFLQITTHSSGTQRGQTGAGIWKSPSPLYHQLDVGQLMPMLNAGGSTGGKGAKKKEKKRTRTGRAITDSWHARCLSDSFGRSGGAVFTWQGRVGGAGVGLLVWAHLCVCAEATGDDLHSLFPWHLTEFQVGPHQLDMLPALIWWSQKQQQQQRGQDRLAGKKGLFNYTVNNERLLSQLREWKSRWGRQPTIILAIG